MIRRHILAGMILFLLGNGGAPALEDGINYSRIIELREGQILEIPFREAGWVYLGEMKSQGGLEYRSRRPDPEGQSFVFRAEKAGIYGLKFYKQDFIRDYIVNDHVQVIITAASPQSGGSSPEESRIIAGPRWPLLPGDEAKGSGTVGSPPAKPSAPVPEAELSDPSWEPTQTKTADSRPPENAPAAPEKGDSATATATTATATATALQNPEDYIRSARSEYEAGHIPESLAVLDQFKERYPVGSDEAWWLYGQLLEADSPGRDVRTALDYYRRLTREYPQSQRCAEAKRRISYLERFYFTIQ